MTRRAPGVVHQLLVRCGHFAPSAARVDAGPGEHDKVPIDRGYGKREAPV